jgi:hypothetical protein
MTSNKLQASPAHEQAPESCSHGQLRNGNPSGPTFGPGWPGKDCGARTRAGRICPNPAMPNGRCRMHGGKSTGPRTEEGRHRAAQANWKHGRRSRKTPTLRDAERLIALAEWCSRLVDRAKRGLPAEPCPKRLRKELLAMTQNPKVAQFLGGEEALQEVFSAMQIPPDG